MDPHLTVRATTDRGGAIPGLFARRGIELTNESAEPLRDLVVSGLGRPFLGVAFLGSPVALLPAGESVPFLFDRPPGRADQWLIRVSGESADGNLFAFNLTCRPPRP